MSSKRGSIVTGEAHVWLAYLDGLRDAPTLVSYEETLSAEERVRLGRFRFDGDRLASLVAYGLVRSALSSCAPVISPAGWVFARSRSGRPEIVGPGMRPPLRFNISHTHGLVACVVTLETDCGIDVEATDRMTEVDDLAGLVLSPLEIGTLRALAPKERRWRFLRYWTLKEAYTKARGEGLSLPLENITFELGEKAPLLETDLNMDAGCEGDWQFEQWAETARHLVAVALRRGGASNHRIIRHVVSGHAAPDRPGGNS